MQPERPRFVMSKCCAFWAQVIDIWKDLGELDLTGAWCNSCTFHLEIVYVLCIVSAWLAQVFYYPVPV